MSVQGVDDVPHTAPCCLRCWPTGVECLRFYVSLLLTVVVLVVTVTHLLFRYGANEGLDCNMFALLAFMIAYWLPAPETPSPGQASTVVRGAEISSGV